MTYTYYVDPGYWDTGYTEDITISYVDTSSVVSGAGSGLVITYYLKDGAAASAGAGTVLTGGVRYRGIAGLSSATGTTYAAGRFLYLSSTAISGTGLLLGAIEQIRTYPGVNLNTKSEILAASAVKYVSGALISARSSTKAGSRIFWENTSPSNGTWIEVVPQGEGFGS